MRTTVRLPEDLLKRAKRKAAASGTTLTALIEEGLRTMIDEKARSPGRRQIALPVSKAKGGFAPAFSDVDAGRFASAVEASEDFESLRRARK